MGNVFRIDDIRQALESRDPELASMVNRLASQYNEQPDDPIREGAPNYWKYCEEVTSWSFQRLTKEEQIHVRKKGMAEIEASDAEVPLPDRLKLDKVLLTLWRDDSLYARDQLRKIVQTVPLRWGPWRAIKQIFKEAEEQLDLEMFGVITARLDAAYATRRNTSEISRRTLAYLCRRAWRFLRQIAHTLPLSYADACMEVLRFYPEGTQWANTWVANHILFHEKGYTRRRFRFYRVPNDMLRFRAFPELWRRTHRPLFTLLERAQADLIRRYVTDALKADFRVSLREVKAEWVTRLITVQSPVVDEFVIWLLNNVPTFEQGAFRELGLHEAVLSLLHSQSSAAQDYAAEYLRVHARDLPLDELIALANNTHKTIRKTVRDLLSSRDPRKEVGLEAWGRLLGTEYGHQMAQDALHKHFGAKELTLDWFEGRLTSSNYQVVDFAKTLLPKIHPLKSVDPSYFLGILDNPQIDANGIEAVFEFLESYPIDDSWMPHFKQQLLNPSCQDEILGLLESGRLTADMFGVDYLKMLAFHPPFETDPFIVELKTSNRTWAHHLTFNDLLSNTALELLKDVRTFTPDQIGFDWLMQLVNRSEPGYHNFATEYMTKAFLPADFAESSDSSPAEETPSDEPITVDLESQTFLFTGKLATMTRGEAKKKVTSANGKNASGITGKLNYLVIGDEGSPLYGAGRKGSKQVKAEKLMADGAPLKIISETAFLQMLSGQTRKMDENTSIDGCERLWAMATDPKGLDKPLSKFALHYLRHHHPDICLKETDRPVDPGAEVPETFLTFERMSPLLLSTHAPLRRFALEMLSYELSRMAPPIEDLIPLCESDHDEVREFFAKALTAEDTTEHSKYRISPEQLTADAVYRLCESLNSHTRKLGMGLIAAHPRLSVPEELFRLTESPDRVMRGFAIRQLWGRYRNRHITDTWRPLPAKKDDKEKREAPSNLLEKPEALPAPITDLRDFLKRTLFQIPAAKLPKKGSGGKDEDKLPLLSSRKAKLALIDVSRDLALEDIEFARLIAPLYKIFLRSGGKSEQAACLVALTQITQQHPALVEKQDVEEAV